MEERPRIVHRRRGSARTRHLVATACGVMTWPDLATIEPRLVTCRSCGGSRIEEEDQVGKSRLQPKERRRVFKALDGLVKRFPGGVALAAMRKYLDATKQRQRAQREIADAEKRLAELRRKIGG